MPFEYRHAVRHAFLENPVAQRAVRLAAEGVGSAPLVPTDEKLADLLAATSAGQKLLETLAAQLLLHGNCYVQILKDAAGRPIDLFGLRPERVSVVPGADGWPAAWRYRVGEKVLTIPLEDEQGWPNLIHIKAFHPADDHYGAGCLEAAAQAGHLAGATFVLLDGSPVALDPAKVGPSQGASIDAIGLGDSGPVSDPIADPGITLRPLASVHPRAERLADGSLDLSWTRRARGAWTWPDEVEIPLGEQTEAYRVGLGPADAPVLAWDVVEPALSIDAATLASLASEYPGAALWVRQIGSFAMSDPLLLTTLP